MTLLREIDAFEACWLDLKDTYPTTRADKTLIAQAMGQLVDRRYQSPAAVEAALPLHLRGLLRQLAVAYFQGYTPHPPLPASPPPLPLPPPCQKEAISDAVAQVRRLADLAQQRLLASGRCTADRIDFETLVVEMPDTPY